MFKSDVPDPTDDICHLSLISHSLVLLVAHIAPSIATTFLEYLSIFNVCRNTRFKYIFLNSSAHFGLTQRETLPLYNFARGIDRKPFIITILQ